MRSDAPLSASISARLVLRETLISSLINAAISALLFAAMFGFRQAPAARALGWDCLPQAFMVALMGSLVPGLILRRRNGKPVGGVVRMAILLAVISLLVFGGGACAAFLKMDPATIPVAHAFVLKVVLGALIACLITPLAVVAVLRPGAR